ncbi:MAG: PASTA domain-containing protein [Gaiellaceae bacterium]
MRKLLPALLLAAGALALTATLTYAAGQKLAAAPHVRAHAAATPATLVVPDVRNEAFVFAKGQLEDAGFAWRVAGAVHGYAANTVVAQSPAPGTRLVDTGAPPIVVRLSRNAHYAQAGEPEDSSPYAATALEKAAAP